MAPLTLDDTDRAILRALQENARISNKELAARVHLAPSSCHARVQRLLKTGVVQGFHTDIDPKALGVGIQALITVRLTNHSRAVMDAVYESIAELRETVAVYRLAGADDLLVHVAVHDVEHLRRLTLEQLSDNPEVNYFETALIYEYRRSSGLPNLTDAAD